jgi:hypothetical protein
MVETQAIQDALHELRKPCFSTSMKLDGEHVIVTWHSLEHIDTIQRASPLSSSSSSSSSSTSVSSKTTTTTTTYPNVCATCRRQAYESRISYLDFSFQKRPISVCCCGPSTRSSSQPQERWLIRAYHPATNHIYRLKIQNERLRELIRPYADGYEAIIE